MIEKPLNEISYADIEQLVHDKWPEGKTTEYKRESYGAADSNKKELLKDVSSFANTSGGDILIGVEEDQGLPVSVPGITIDADAEKLRLEEIIRAGLDPRIEFAIHHIGTPNSTFVLIIRVLESQLFPHRVVFKGKFGEFWARSSAGKYSMDTSELRAAFNLSESIYDKIRQFRIDRVQKILDSDTPVPMMSGGKLILHLIPVSSFRARQQFDVATMPNLATQFPPIGSSGWDHRLNLDGHVTYGGGRGETGVRAYSQFFRNGILESVLGDITREGEREGKLLTPGYYEYQLTQQYRAFEKYLQGLNQLEIQPPIWCCLSLVGVKNARIPTDGYFPDERREIDRDVLLLPETLIEDLSANPTTVLKPMFDLIWNASGYIRSFNFDENGNWIGR